LYFPETGACYLIPETDGTKPQTVSSFRRHFNCPIGFVPILGPVDQNERLYQEEAARLALFNYTAARNFRNIWYHYPEHFGEFRRTLRDTWPGMDVEPPKVDYSHDKPRLHMFCPEERIPRELFWSGFGFQVWCQMLTHLVQSKHKSLFLIDEPDIYLHAELQRQLLRLLKNLGPDIIIATHSTEIITEADADDIVLISKKRRSARRIRQPSDVAEVFSILGSNLNPILTQLAKTRRAVFVEGQDFQILGRFAQRLSATKVAGRTEFATITVDGFSPDRIRTLKKGIETTLGGKIGAAAVLDRDYRSKQECESIWRACGEFCDLVWIHDRKEVENYVLSVAAIDRSCEKRVRDRVKRTGQHIAFVPCTAEILERFASSKKHYVASQHLASWRRFQRSITAGVDEATANETALSEFEVQWSEDASRLSMIPGKEAFRFVNQELQSRYHVSVTPTAVVDVMTIAEVPQSMKDLISALSAFTKVRPGSS
jgi:energy-coupling factor transporter ATP-binding protein EcfA2